MHWRECSVMDERLRFVARILDGEAMSEAAKFSTATRDAILFLHAEHEVPRRPC